MPTYLFKCENNHKMEKYKCTPYKKSRRYRCLECGLWMYRDYYAEHAQGRRPIHLDENNEPISHMSKKRSFKGAWIKNLTPQPIRVENEKQYHDLLKQTNSREKLTGVG